MKEIGGRPFEIPSTFYIPFKRTNLTCTMYARIICDCLTTVTLEGVSNVTAITNRYCCNIPSPEMPETNTFEIPDSQPKRYRFMLKI